MSADYILVFLIRRVVLGESLFSKVTVNCHIEVYLVLQAYNRTAHCWHMFRHPLLAVSNLSQYVNLVFHSEFGVLMMLQKALCSLRNYMDYCVFFFK